MSIFSGTAIEKPKTDQKLATKIDSSANFRESMRFKESGHRAIASGQARAADLQLPSNTPLNRHV